jgi:hypothetical protein
MTEESKRTLDLTDRQRQILETADRTFGEAQRQLETVVNTILAGYDIETARILDLTGNKLTVEIPDAEDE